MAEEWIKLDVRFYANDKLLSVSVEARWVYVVGLGVAGRDLTDGLLRPALVVAEAEVEDDPTAELVHAGLWHRAGHGCQDCPQPLRGRIVVHDYLKHQRSREEAEAARTAASEKARKAARARWDAREHAPSNAPSNARSNAPSNAKPMPESEAEVDTSRGSQSPTGSRVPRPTDDDLEAIQQATNAPRSHAERVWALILARAKTTPSSPRRYVLAAIKASPDDYRQKRSNPRKEQECPEHSGEWADSCRQHQLIENAKNLGRMPQ